MKEMNTLALQPKKLNWDEVDKPMHHLIKYLNKHGYETVACCQGGGEPHSCDGAYVVMKYTGCLGKLQSLMIKHDGDVDLSMKSGEVRIASSKSGRQGVQILEKIAKEL